MTLKSTGKLANYLVYSIIGPGWTLETFGLVFVDSISCENTEEKNFWFLLSLCNSPL